VPFANTPLPELDDPQRGDAIVLADSSVEGETIAGALRTRGFIVFDAPLSLLEARVAGEDPRVVIVDVDQPGAIEKTKRMRATPAGERAELLCLGDPLRAAELADLSISDNVFERPVDIARLCERVGHLASPAAGGFSGRGTTPPPMYASRQSVAPAPDSIPPISDFPRGVDPLEVGSFLEEGAEGSAALELLAGNMRLSPELAAQIAEAEERMRAQLDGRSSIPAAPEESDCLVPPDLLQQLDEPLDVHEESEEGTGGVAAALAQAGSSAGTGSMSQSSFTPAPRLIGTGAGTPSPEGTAALPAPRSNPGFSGSSDIPPPQFQATGAATSEAFAPSAPGSFNTSPRAGSPALGIRLGELLGLKVEDARRPEPPARPAFVPSPTSTGIESQTLRGEDALLPGNAHLPTPLGLASLASPLSPPMRFQEARDIAEGRPVFDIRTIPPRDPLASLRDHSPIVVPPSASLPQFSASRGSDGGVSPAAASVRAATSRDSTLGTVFGEGEGMRPLGRAIAARTTGCLAITVGEIMRRVVLLDGDIVTAASESADESLVSFLAGRGDLGRDAAMRLSTKLPPSGRHAGAALIAQGFLAQDDLWPVLRSHAEWLIGKILRSGPGGVMLEPELPVRLKAEPGVFGGATGAEIFVETARRVLDPAVSISTIGERARLDAGTQKNLLSECALSEEEDVIIRQATGKTVVELCQGAEPELACVVRALIELEVLSKLAPISKVAEPVAKPPDDLIDEHAVRAKTKAKMALVQEGDYFALLGVNRSATSYEIRRAYVDLRRSFEPTRLLTARTSDLYDDVQLILEIVEEAFEILRDGPKRERYRRAIEAGPPD